MTSGEYSKPRPILVFATKGTGSNEEDRIKALVSGHEYRLIPYDKQAKKKSFLGLLRVFRSTVPSLIVMEGTGIAGGLACMIGRLFFGHRYVVSSGDAVGPFVASHFAILGPVFGLYERLLCCWSSGFIGWTPYLVGRALTFGAPMGMTAPGWVIGKQVEDYAESRRRVREKWEISEKTIVFGIAGAINWSKRRRYCYGLELVRAIRRVRRDDVAVVIIGDGSGIEHLRQEAGPDLGKRVFLPGRVALDEVMENLCGFDVASLPQSTDGVGAFRYTTKISEYRGLNLPIVTTRIPAAYDLDLGYCWRLAGENPWDPKFIEVLAELMQEITADELAKCRSQDKSVNQVFDQHVQVARVTAFLADVLSKLMQMKQGMSQ
jgi:hypothetical protein